MDHFRSQGKTVSIEETTLSCSKTDEEPGKPGSNKIPVKEWDVSPEKIVEDIAFRETLQKCLDRLPGNAKELFLMREADEVESAELCKDFNLSATNLWTTLHRIRNQLRNCLEKSWFR